MLKALVRGMASRSAPRHYLNTLYAMLPARHKALCQRHFAKLFRQGEWEVDDGVWFVEFAGKRIALPLSGERMWLDWDNALSILGHDVEIKTAYEALVASERKPRVFFDIGANYGLHSLLFLVHGVHAVAFEPNPRCHGECRALCKLNDVDCDLQALALGAQAGERKLWFPNSETWQGTTDAGVKERFASDESIEVLTVEQTTLDAFVEASALSPELVKIDTEGTEVEVLQGGVRTLHECRPLVIFESWSRRTELFEVLEGSGYGISTLPLEGNLPLDHPGFLKSASSNFMATPHA